MDYKNLEKLYPVKIPVYQHAEYYLDTLSKSKQYSQLSNWISMCKSYETIDNYRELKYKAMDNIISYFKDQGIYNKLNDFKLPVYKLSKKELHVHDGDIYLSLDVSQANWTIIKHYLQLDLPIWEEYSQNILNLHPALANSKSFRQVIFGNWNPKRINSLQEYTTSIHLNMVSKYNIVGINSDEIILKVSSKDEVSDILNINWVLPVKGTLFRANFHENYTETIRIDTILNIDFEPEYQKLTKVIGNRYFIHFKTLILKEELDERDLLFTNDRKVAKWVL